MKRERFISQSNYIKIVTCQQSYYQKKMIIKEDLKQFDTQSQIISNKELYLQATDILILKFKRTQTYIQDLKINIIFDECRSQLQMQLLEKQQNQQQDCDIPINHILKRSKEEKKQSQNLSSSIFSKCSVCQNKILSEAGLGDNLKKKRKI
ncbi:unnamed protein product (macronuclear) [Paramecium tetraurelia]|uniref:Uncharacterized protein n=1 Tax=Paramecium tetraurelia TaxID=5888 RepID=A0E2R0_PARTE|nr:uncharacterized protein GSPATT00022749001 [Paramecium tetraurelia]CAK89577.1 unnamed protein product [Paramecium tetraurelia]|eukprot:XP_001456974.1 hypothetical protein (macronuclear) [Paramecium tetraurelia strain d4-2]